MNEPTLTLNGWIEAATAGLPPSAAEKFRAEIADHFAEAHRAHIAAGMSADEAEHVALAALGDAAQVARTLRDAHFSRREYARGEGIIILLMAVGAAGQVSPRLGWWPISRAVYDFGLCAALLMIMRPVLVLMHEQYDVRVPRAARMAFAGAVIAAMVPDALRVLLQYNGYGTLAVMLNIPVSSLLGAVNAIFPFLYEWANTAIGVLLIALCMGLWAARPRQPVGVPDLLMILCSGVGIEMVLSYAPIFTDAGADIRAVVGTLHAVPYAALLVTLLGLFARMRRPGAALAR